jgi:hypothetical protein
MMTQKEMLHIVQTQLAVDLNCTVDDLNSEKDSIIFVEAKENPGRRPFQRKEHYFEILSMGKSIVVSATPERLSIAKTQMQGKDRDTVFSLPFITGLYLHYLPDLKIIKPVSPPENFSFEVVERDEVADLLNNKDLITQSYMTRIILIILTWLWLQRKTERLRVWQEQVKLVQSYGKLA